MLFLENEIALLSQLSHPNILTYHGYVKKEGVLQIVTDYLAGGSLNKVLKEMGVLPKHLIFNYTTQILEALDYIHQRGKCYC